MPSTAISGLVASCEPWHGPARTGSWNLGADSCIAVPGPRISPRRKRRGAQAGPMAKAAWPDSGPQRVKLTGGVDVWRQARAERHRCETRQPNALETVGREPRPKRRYASPAYRSTTMLAMATKISMAMSTMTIHSSFSSWPWLSWSLSTASRSATTSIRFVRSPTRWSISK